MPLAYAMMSMAGSVNRPANRDDGSFAMCSTRIESPEDRDAVTQLVDYLRGLLNKEPGRPLYERYQAVLDKVTPRQTLRAYHLLYEAGTPVADLLDILDKSINAFHRALRLQAGRGRTRTASPATCCRKTPPCWLVWMPSGSKSCILKTAGTAHCFWRSTTCRPSSPITPRKRTSSFPSWSARPLFQRTRHHVGPA
jgi:hypothetical protein